MRVVIALIGAAVSATPARAELVFFATGRSLSVRGHRVDGDLLVLSLRSGGEIICERSVIVRIEPDEVPYPEPQLGTPDQPASVGGAYAALVDQIAAEQGIDGHMAKLVKAVIHVESAYQERARSRKGAMGLMQLMPETARQYAVADPYEPRSNIEAGIKHLKSLLARFELPLALAAYNAGEEAVRRFGGIPPYPETRSYVSRVLAELGR
jgi:soluble lytic murein transglycosylase-like protein